MIIFCLQRPLFFLPVFYDNANFYLGKMFPENESHSNPFYPLKVTQNTRTF